MGPKLHIRRNARGFGAVVPRQAEISTAEMLTFEAREERARYKTLRGKVLLDFRFVSFSELESIDLDAAVRRLLAVGSWANLFSIMDDGYAELTLEFLSTLRCREVVDEISGEPITLSFRMLGQTFTMGPGMLAVYAGIYTQAELENTDVLTRPHEFPTGVSPSEFWQTITERDAPYEASAAKSTSIVSPALRYIQHLIGYSINARTMSSNVAGWQDLLYLYSMHQLVPLHLGRVLAQYLLHHALYAPLKSIGGAHYISKIGKGLGIMEGAPRMVVAIEGQSITLGMMQAFKLVKRVQSGRGFTYVLLGRGPVDEESFDIPEGSSSAGSARPASATPGPSTSARQRRAPRKVEEEVIPAVAERLSLLEQSMSIQHEYFMRIGAHLGLDPPPADPIRMRYQRRNRPQPPDSPFGSSPPS